MKSLNRRELLKAACACAGCPLLVLCTQPAHAAGEATETDIGPLEEFAGEGAYDLTRRGHQFFLVNRKGRLYAVSSTCTHKAVKLTAARGAGGFKCPRHGSLFDITGRVTKAPARKSLPRFAIRLDDTTRHVIVDPSCTFKRSEWDNPAAFVDLSATAPR
jgi:nitrite reductase/ring-hydroxylating ferredoxin subunit